MSEDWFDRAAASIVEQDREAAVEVATEALAAGIEPADIMQRGFVRGIAEVGELFEGGEPFLPELMMAAQATEGAMEVTNAALGEGAERTRGTVVLGTVQGDVHDIGKAIVIAYLKANSFEVYDLGRDCPLETFIAKAEEHSAQVIAMSASSASCLESPLCAPFRDRPRFRSSRAASPRKTGLHKDLARGSALRCRAGLLSC